MPGARHRDAGAIEAIAPVSNTSHNPQARESHPPGSSGVTNRRIMPNQSQSTQVGVNASSSNDVLVIASRIKDHIHKKSEFNTSAGVMDVLSQHLRIICERAIDNARSDGRKTVMDRDFKFLSNLHF